MRILNFIAALSVTLSACQGRPASKAEGETAITDKSWTLKELEGQPLDSTSTANPPTLMLSSSNSQASGNAGCNRMAGPYTLGAGTLELGPLAMTRMACPAMEVESRYTKALAGVKTYRIETNQLLLLADGRVVARFDPAGKQAE